MILNAVGKGPVGIQVSLSYECAVILVYAVRVVALAHDLKALFRRHGLC